jgi:hypothetical protein
MVRTPKKEKSNLTSALFIGTKLHKNTRKNVGKQTHKKSDFFTDKKVHKKAHK